MAAIVFTDIQSCLGANAETLYNPGSPISDAWFTSGFIDMGTRPNGDNTSDTWTPDNSSFKSAGFWNAVVPWVTIYPGATHSATNTRVEISNFKCLVYSISQKNWVDLTANDTKIPTSQNNYNFNLLTAIGSADSRVEASGNVSYKLNVSKNPIKFSLNPKRIYGEDVGGVFITCDAKLILDNGGGTDDRASAHLLVSVGADYRPSISNVDLDFYPEVSPKVCGSKFSLVTNTNKTFYSIPLTPPGIVDTSSDYASAGGRATVDFDWFKTNFPRSFYARDVLNDAEMNIKLKTTIVPDKASATVTFTRNSVATVFDNEGKLVTVPANCVRFTGARYAKNATFKNETIPNTNYTYTNLTSPPPSGFTDSLGGTKALKFVATSSTSPLFQNAGHPIMDSLSGTIVCFSIDIKRGNWDWYAFHTQKSGGSKTAIQYVNLGTMTLGSQTTSGGGAIINCTLTPTADPLWYRLNLAVQFAIGDTPYFQVRPVAANGSLTSTGTIGSEILVAFHQSENVEYKSVRTSLNGYVSRSTLLAVPYHGLNVDSIKCFDTDVNGIAIPENVITGYEFNSVDKTNNILYCRDFTNAAWVKTNITAALNQTGICGIAANASLLTASSTNGTVLQALTLKKEYRSSSAYVKRSNGTGSIFFTRDGGTTWIDITSLINSTSFVRVKIEKSTILNPSIGFKIAVSGDAIIVDYVQDEVGTTCSNPILTTSAAVTRVADVLTYTTAGNINDTEGTLLATIKRNNWDNNKGMMIGYDINHGISLSPDSTANIFILEDGTNKVGLSTKKFNPGHYIQAVYNSSGAIQNWSNIITEITNHLYLQGVQLRYHWRDLETADGVYDFSDIRSRANDLKAIGKRFIILIDIKNGLNGATVLDTVPDYIKNGGSYDGGQFTYKTAANPTGAGTTIKLYNSNVLTKFKALLAALAVEFDSNNLLESVGISDTYPEQPLDPLLATSNELKEPFISDWFTNLLNIDTAANSYFAKTSIYQNCNYPRDNLTSFVPSLISAGISLGCKNVMPDEPTLNGVAGGSDGVYEYFSSAKDNVARFCTIDSGDYDYTNLAGSGGSVPTVNTLFKYAKKNLFSSHLIWTRKDSTVAANILALFSSQLFAQASQFGDVLFKTKFGSGVTINPTITTSTASYYLQDVQGKDSETGFSFPPTRLGANTVSRVEYITNAALGSVAELPDNVIADIREYTDPEDGLIKNQFYVNQIIDPVGPGVAQTGIVIRRSALDPALDQVYIKARYKMPENLSDLLHPEVSSGHWKTVFEWKSDAISGGGDFRIAFQILKDLDTGQLYWRSGTDTKANRVPTVSVDYWTDRNFDVPVILGEWFDMEMFLIRGTTGVDDGTILFIVNDDLISFNDACRTMGDFSDKLGRCFIGHDYSGGDPADMNMAGCEFRTGRPVDPAGRLHTKVPSKFISGSTIAANESVKVSASWLSNLASISKDGVLSTFGKYDGALNLTTLYIGNQSNGSIKDIYIWKNVISDEEKRQITAKVGVSKSKQIRS